jgi:diguanylate cyclase (GGDEF)-like protein
MDFPKPSSPFSGGTPEIPQAEIDLRLAYLKYNAEDQRNLNQAWDYIQSCSQHNIDRFYAHVGAFAETGSYIQDGRQLDRLRGMQQHYLRELFCAPVDPAYVDNRLRIGMVHHHIGLEPHWYLGSCSQLLSEITHSLEPILTEDPRFYAAAMQSVIKRLFLDMGIAMNAYVFTDRHALSKSTSSLRESEALLSEAHDLAQLARWELFLPEGPLNGCPRAQEMLHLEQTQEKNGYERLRYWVNPADRAEVDAAFASTLASGVTYDVRYRVEHPGHPLRMLRERGRALLENGKPVRVVGTVQDISLQVSQLSRIEQLALFDDLTQLPNRANFLGNLERHLIDAGKTRKPFSLLFIDLDDFKEINDTQGHSVGDEVLIEVARRLKENLKPQEMVARLGGDEFVVLTPTGAKDGATTAALRFSTAIGRPLWIGQSMMGIRASIGIASCPEDGLKSGLLLRNADIAMYAAKSSRSGIEIYRPEMSERLLRRAQLASRLQHALDEGALELYYQPQVTVADGTLVGAEALLRWHDPVLGQVSPDEFIPLAEHRGLIGAVGQWVAAQACRQLHHWESAGRALPGQLAINISPRQLDDPQFAEQLLELVRQAGVLPGKIDLELTESGIMIDPESSLSILQKLKDAGFSLSLDDFGMGYSSLAHLRGFPLDKIKLDRSFVLGMLEQPHDYAIVVATIAMAQSLGLRMVAEGVESALQVDALKRLGCSHAQGYFYGVPLPAEQFAEQWLNT